LDAIVDLDAKSNKSFDDSDVSLYFKDDEYVHLWLHTRWNDKYYKINKNITQEELSEFRKKKINNNKMWYDEKHSYNDAIKI
jgi:hypothetical protein